MMIFIHLAVYNISCD